MGLRPYRSSELLDQERTPSSPPEVRSPSLIKAQCADRLVRRNHSWSTQHGQGEGVRGEGEAVGGEVGVVEGRVGVVEGRGGGGESGGGGEEGEGERGR